VSAGLSVALTLSLSASVGSFFVLTRDFNHHRGKGVELAVSVWAVLFCLRGMDISFYDTISCPLKGWKSVRVCAHACICCVPFNQGIGSFAACGRNSGGLLCLSVCVCVFVSECVLLSDVAMLPGLQYALCLSFTRPVLVNRLQQESFRFLMGYPWQLDPFFFPFAGVVQHFPQCSPPFPTSFSSPPSPFFSAVRAASDGRTQFHNAILLSPAAHFDKTVSLSRGDGFSVIQFVWV